MAKSEKNIKLSIFEIFKQIKETKRQNYHINTVGYVKEQLKILEIKTYIEIKVSIDGTYN